MKYTKDILEPFITSKDYRVGAKKLVRALLEFGRIYKCELCGLTNKWQEKKLVLEVDHINRNWKDNRPENLRFVCPNCHSQL